MNESDAQNMVKAAQAMSALAAATAHAAEAQSQVATILHAAHAENRGVTDDELKEIEAIRSAAGDRLMAAIQAASGGA